MTKENQHFDNNAKLSVCCETLLSWNFSRWKERAFAFNKIGEHSKQKAYAWNFIEDIITIPDILTVIEQH